MSLPMLCSVEPPCGNVATHDLGGNGVWSESRGKYLCDEHYARAVAAWRPVQGCEMAKASPCYHSADAPRFHVYAIDLSVHARHLGWQWVAYDDREDVYARASNGGYGFRPPLGSPPENLLDLVNRMVANGSARTLEQERAEYNAKKKPLRGSSGVERCAHNADVAGSNPAPATEICTQCGIARRLVRHERFCMAVHEFKDAEGRHHHHDANQFLKAYCCGCPHEYQVRGWPKCWCGWTAAPTTEESGSPTRPVGVTSMTGTVTTAPDNPLESG